MPPPMTWPALLFDASRLYQRRHSRVASGIDRVNLRHAVHFLRHSEIEGFFGLRRGEAFELLPHALAARFLDHLEAVWLKDREPSDAGDAVTELDRLLADPLEARTQALDTRLRLKEGRRPAIYFNSGHAELDRFAYLNGIRERQSQRMIFYIHDLIPSDLPEYVPDGQGVVHRDRLRTISRFRPWVLANSVDTAQRYRAFHRAAGREVDVPAVIKIGIEPKFLRPVPMETPEGPPRFLMLGTIEPRKNHIAMLHLWRRFAATLPVGDIPRLVIVGRRGWQNEEVFSLLDQCPLLRDVVEQHASLSDTQLLAEMARARALLFPSFAEGWGMPVLEAIAHGLPVIAADIPVLREAGGSVPEFIDPLAVDLWGEAILDYARPEATRRRVQLDRMAARALPDWSTHLADLDSVVATAAADPGFSALESKGRTPRPALRTPVQVVDPRRSLKVAPLLAAWSAQLSKEAKAARARLDQADLTGEAGDWHRDRGAFAEAAVCYDQTVSLRPDATAYWVQLGHMLKEVGCVAEAHSAYLHAQALSPDDPEVSLQIGHLFTVAEDFVSARAYYETALLSDPDNADCRASLARVEAAISAAGET
ncbi:MAG: glycosyltransferase [Pseudomonadota bacterium]